MIAARLSRRADELRAARAPFVLATVVRAQRPTSVRSGDTALVLGDGTIEGFVGGACAEQSVRLHALRALETGEGLLLRILPGDDEGPAAEGAVTVSEPMPGRAARWRSSSSRCCPPLACWWSGHADRPRAGADGRRARPRHGRRARRRRRARRPTTSRSSSPPTGATSCSRCAAPWTPACPTSASWPAACAARPLSPSCTTRACPEERLAIGSRPRQGSTSARAPRRRSRSRSWRGSSPPPSASRRSRCAWWLAVQEVATAIDPVCGMAVAAIEQTPHAEHQGRTVYFCCEGCRTSFQHDPPRYLTAH